MGITLILGILVGVGCIISGYLLEHGALQALVAPSSLLIVVGGTISVVIASFPPNDLIKAVKAFFRSMSKKGQPNPTLVIEKMAKISDLCRQSGILRLEEVLKDPELGTEDFLLLKEGLIYILDGKDVDDIQYAMMADIRTYTIQKQQEIAVFENAGGYSPTLGVVGTVMSLIVALGNMEGQSSAQLAKAISTAFVATFYGVGFANLVYLPIATRLKANLKRQKIQREMILDGVCMIARGESSRSVENKLSPYWQAFPKGDKKYKEGILK